MTERPNRKKLATVFAIMIILSVVLIFACTDKSSEAISSTEDGSGDKVHIFKAGGKFLCRFVPLQVGNITVSAFLIYTDNQPNLPFLHINAAINTMKLNRELRESNWSLETFGKKFYYD